MKKVLAAAFVVMFVVATASVSYAAKVKCEDTGVDGETVTLNSCAIASKFKEGDKLKISTPKKGAAVEGC